MRVGPSRPSSSRFARISTIPFLFTALLSALNISALRYNESLRAWNFNYNQGKFAALAL